MLRDVLDNLQLTGAIVVWVVTVTRVAMIRKPSSRVLWFALFALAVGQTLQVEPVYRAVDNAAGTPGAAALVKHAAALFAAANTASIVATLVGAKPRNQQRARLAMAVALMLSVVPWLIRPPAAVPPSLLQRAEYYDSTARGLVHWMAFLSYLGWTLWIASRICWRFRRIESNRDSRIGVTMVGAGTTIGLGYVAEKTLTEVAWASGHGPAFVLFDQTAEAIILAASVSLIAVGTAYQAATTRIAQRIGHHRDHAAWQRIRPLALRLQVEFPDIQTPVGLSSSERLVAALATTHEGLRRLTAYLPPSSLAEAALTRRDCAAHWLHEALSIKAAGNPPQHAMTALPLSDSGLTRESAIDLALVYRDSIEARERRPARQLESRR
ncbi:MAG: hypothetical protein JWN95_1365 [Frankiales bacterium]|nr:hypothetical protein [Frankiales bacterium]